MPVNSLTLTATYTLTGEGAVGSRLELLRQSGSTAGPELLFRNRRVLTIKAKEEADLPAGMRYGQKRLYDWGAELLRAASSLAPAILINPLAADAHIRDLRLGFGGQFVVRPLFARSTSQDIVLRSAHLDLSAASRPQRGLWHWEYLGRGKPREDADIFIADLGKVSDFTDPAAVLGAWRALRADVQHLHLERLRGLLEDLPDTHGPWPA
jgi:hypothetical protein